MAKSVTYHCDRCLKEVAEVNSGTVNVGHAHVKLVSSEYVDLCAECRRTLRLLFINLMDAFGLKESK